MDKTGTNMKTFSFEVDNRFMVTLSANEFEEALMSVRDVYPDAKKLEIRRTEIESKISFAYGFEEIAFYGCEINIGVVEMKCDLHMQFHNCNMSNLRISRSKLTMVDVYNCYFDTITIEESNIYVVNILDTWADTFALRQSNFEKVFLNRSRLRNSYIVENKIKFSIDLSGTDISGSTFKLDKDVKVRYNYKTVGYATACPEKGSFIAYKRCYSNRIVTLLIPEDAKRSSSTSHKCRCSKALVLKIEDGDGREYDEAISMIYDDVYKKGEMIEVKDFDEDRWNECSTGIHFFMDKGMAIEY